jgi:hypothetical protein
MDILSPKTKTPEGFTKILTIIDTFTRWTLAIPLRAAGSIDIAKAIFTNVLCIFGKPNRIISDNGTEFLNVANEYMFQRWGIETTFTGGYNPQANPVERYHRYINSTMTMLAQSHGGNWAEHLPAAVFAYNSSVCASTGYTPYELVFGGRKPTLLHDLNLQHLANELGLDEDGATDKPRTTFQEFQHEAHTRMLRTYQEVRVHQQAVAEKNLKARKAKHPGRNHQYSIGDLVMYYEPAQMAKVNTGIFDNADTTLPQKWTPQWTGPHLVTATHTGTTTTRYTISHASRAAEIQCPANRLQPFHRWSPDIISTSYELDKNTGFRTGEWVKIGSLVVVPITGHNFAIAKVLGCETDGKLDLQWYGNDTNNPNGTHLPGWWHNRTAYYASMPKDIADEPYRASDSGLQMHQRHVAIHDFRLTPGGRIPAALKRKIMETPEIGWNGRTTRQARTPRKRKSTAATPPPATGSQLRA